MTINRVTQSMLSQRSLDHLQLGLGRLSQLQEQLSSGRSINRPSDSPTGTSSAMRLRDAMTQVQQHQRAAQDGQGWLDTIDQSLSRITDQTRQARNVALQGANNGTVSQASREALAATVDQLRSNLLSESNARYVGRPVFGGITPGSQAYDAAGAFVGEAGQVLRTVGDAVKVRVDVDGEAVFGAAGANVFADLETLSAALRANDSAGISQGITQLNGHLDRLTQVHAEVGTRAARVEQAQQVAQDNELRLRSSLSEIENVDLPAVVVDLELQEVAYQASLAATARVLQPSLLDFLR